MGWELHIQQIDGEDGKSKTEAGPLPFFKKSIINYIFILNSTKKVREANNMLQLLACYPHNNLKARLG